MRKKYNRSSYISSKKIYSDYYVSPSILKIAPLLVDRLYYSDKDSDELYQSQFDKDVARATYQDIGLTFYENKEEMKKALKDYTHNSKFWDTHSLEDYWQQYKQRDILISMGQYNEIRNIMFQQSYLDVVGETLGKESEQYKRLSKLTPEEFLRIATYPNSRTDDPSVYLLPAMQVFYGDKNSSDKIDEYKREINKALNLPEDYGIDTSLSPRDIPSPSNDIYSTIESEYRKIFNAKSRGRIKVKKNGERYILFMKKEISRGVIKRLYNEK